MTEIRAVKPGTLVSLKTHIGGGNVRYRKRDIEYEHIAADGTLQSRWDTTKTVVDPDEQKRASQVVGRARYLITKLCAESRHWLLCPTENTEALDAAVIEARELVDDFNATALYTHVELDVVRGTVAADDLETTRSVFSATERFLGQMQEALQSLERQADPAAVVKKVRAICKQTRDVGQMLAPEANAAVSVAVNAARSACKRIVDAGEQVAVEIDQAAIDTIGMARNSFLDFDFDEVQVEAPSMPSRRLDLEAEAS